MELNSARQDRVLATIFTVCQNLPRLRETAQNTSCGSTYTPLCDILAVVRPAFSAAGLMITFTSHLVGNVFTVQMRVIQVDCGEIFGTELPFLVDTGSAHEIASLLTYARRNLLVSGLNLEHGAEADDDGQAAQRGQPNTASRRQAQAPVQQQSAAPTPSAGEAARSESEAPNATTNSAPAAAEVAKPDPKIQEGIRMNNLWTRLKTICGKPNAEKVLVDAVGTAYIKLVKPDQYATVCAALETKLADASPDAAKAA